MAKVTLSPITGGFQSTSELNDNFTAITSAFTNTLSRDGSTPNSMSADIDMNGNGLLNVGGLSINGIDIIAMYNAWLALTTNITISTSAPSGGKDGDIWFTID